MTKHTVITVLGVVIIIIALGGFPPVVRNTLLVLSGVTISVLAYLSSVVYCSNCKKLIEDAENALPDEIVKDGDVNVSRDVEAPKRIQ